MPQCWWTSTTPGEQVLAAGVEDAPRRRRRRWTPRRPRSVPSLTATSSRSGASGAGAHHLRVSDHQVVVGHVSPFARRRTAVAWVVGRRPAAGAAAGSTVVSGPHQRARSRAGDRARHRPRASAWRLLPVRVRAALSPNFAASSSKDSGRSGPPRVVSTSLDDLAAVGAGARSARPGTGAGRSRCSGRRPPRRPSPSRAPLRVAWPARRCSLEPRAQPAAAQQPDRDGVRPAELGHVAGLRGALDLDRLADGAQVGRGDAEREPLDGPSTPMPSAAARPAASTAAWVKWLAG